MQGLQLQYVRLGLIDGAGKVAGGLLIGAAGASTIWIGYQEKSLTKKIIGGILTVIGTGTAALGMTTLSVWAHNIALGACAGGFFGAVEGATLAVQELYNFDEEKGVGKKPEEIYEIACSKMTDQVNRLVPTKKKLIAASLWSLGLGIVGIAICLPVLEILGLGLLLQGTILLEVGCASALSGFIIGYFFHDKAVEKAETISAIDIQSMIMKAGNNLGFLGDEYQAKATGKEQDIALVLESGSIAEKDVEKPQSKRKSFSESLVDQKGKESEINMLSQ